MITKSNELEETVRNRGNVRLDTSALSEHAVNVLDKRLARAVQPSVERVVKTFEDLEALYEQMGTAKLEAITDAALEVEKASERAERRIEQLSGKLTWTVLGRMSQVLLPYALAFIILGSLVGGFTQMLGLGPLFTWAWDSFVAAGTWWAKSVIALGALSGVSAFVWMLYWFGKKLYESYRGW